MKNLIKAILIVIVIFFGVCLFSLSHHINGWRAFIVESGSMEPTINTGSLVITQKISPDKLKKGDIITFIAPTKEKLSVTHRIISMTNNKNLITLKTKGDNNKTADPWTLLGGGVIGKVTYTISFLGYIMSFLKSKIGILLFILLPSMWIIVDEINNIISLLKNHKKQKTEPVQTITSTILFFFTLLSFSIFNPQPTQALLSDSVILNQNNFTVQTRDKNINGGDQTIITPINQINKTSITNNINVQNSTGNNTVTGNNGDVNITTGSSSVNVTVTNNAGTNSVVVNN